MATLRAFKLATASATSKPILSVIAIMVTLSHCIYTLFNGHLQMTAEPDF
ncbi:MAG: hypothetical protein MN733_12250 [Nitrososphaera sp.]|nr:hypothetical protein [Nitrososphaera sp.]